jgi:hypothetical protein
MILLQNETARPICSPVGSGIHAKRTDREYLTRNRKHSLRHIYSFPLLEEMVNLTFDLDGGPCTPNIRKVVHYFFTEEVVSCSHNLSPYQRKFL